MITVKDDANAPKHNELEVPNLHVMKLCQSLCSRGYLKKRYSWQWFYYFLTNEGIAYLREYLGNLPEEVIPKTHVKTASRPPTSRPLNDRPFSGRRFEGGDRENRDREGGYRRFEKKEGAPQGFNPEFVSHCARTAMCVTVLGCGGGVVLRWACDGVLTLPQRGAGRGRAPREAAQ